MATPGTPSGENHSSDSQKCGLKCTSPRPSSSCWSVAIRSARTLSSMLSAELAHPQVEQLLVGPVGPLLWRQHRRLRHP